MLISYFILCVRNIFLFFYLSDFCGKIIDIIKWFFIFVLYDINRFFNFEMVLYFYSKFDLVNDDL